MPKLQPSTYSRPIFVRDNINSIHTLAKNLHITYGDIARATGISKGTIGTYASGVAFPNQERYNRLAIFFDWEIWE